MKLRMRAHRVSHTFAAAGQPECGGVILVPTSQSEAPEFVSFGRDPGRRFVSAEFRIDSLEPGPARLFEDGGEYLVTVERLPAR